VHAGVSLVGHFLCGAERWCRERGHEGQDREKPRAVRTLHASMLRPSDAPVQVARASAIHVGRGAIASRSGAAHHAAAMFAARSDKRFTELFVLAYTPVWIAAVLWAMTSGVLRGWGDAEHLVFGVVLALPVFAAPFLPRKAAPPLLERHSFRFAYLVTLFSFLQCWMGSKLFFDVFGMEYHFRTSIVWNGTPAFLYFMTVAYFATYYAVQVVVWRAIRRRFPGTLARWLSRAVLAYVTAFAETAGMANDLIDEWFSYTDRTFVMAWGSIAYGAIFFVTLPLFYDLDEDDAQSPKLGAATMRLFALMTICLVVYELYTILVGPFAP
jgi:hypothetical protein